MKKYTKYKKESLSFADITETVKALEKISASRIHQLKKITQNAQNHLGNIKQILTRLDSFYKVSHHPLGRYYGNSPTLVTLSPDENLTGALQNKLAEVFLQKKPYYQ